MTGIIARILIFALLFAAVWYGWRMFQRLRSRGSADDDDEDDTGPRKRITDQREGTLDLERDPKSGVYRPRDADKDDTAQ